MLRNFITANSSLPPIAFHTMNLCDDTIYIYGGIAQNEIISGDLLILPLNSSSLICAKYKMNKHIFPQPRYSHSAVYYQEKNVIYFFGGYIEEKPNFSNDLWQLDLKGKYSRFKQLNSPAISGRCRHACFLHNKKLYIYGGYGLNAINQKMEILNDFYSIDLDSGVDSLKHITFKGGIDMKNILFTVVEVPHFNFRPLPNQDDFNDIISAENDIPKFAFFCNDLRYFFLLQIEEDSYTFTKVLIKFMAPSMRANYTINVIGDMLLLFGGMSVDKSKPDQCFNEAFTFHTFFYSKGIHYGWQAVDIFGAVENDYGKEGKYLPNYGYNGHAAVVLPNDHVFIFGGTRDSYFPLPIAIHGKVYNNPEPIFSRTCKLLNPLETYQWAEPLVPISAEKLNIIPKVQHIMYIIPGESKEAYQTLFIHGGDFNGNLLCHYNLFNLKSLDWMDVSTKGFCPQLKSHACCHLRDPDKKEFYILISGGFTKEHQNCDSRTNKERERCGCFNEPISDKFYCYRNHKFSEIVIDNRAFFGERLKRFGHNMITVVNETTHEFEMYMLCGFAQHIGYLKDIIKFTAYSDPKNKTFRLKGNDLKTGYGEEGINKIDGRMYASVQYFNGNFFIFGGIKEDIPLNDIQIINMETWNNTTLEIDKTYIYPRYGMSSVLYSENPKSARVIIFGGSYWGGEGMVYGATNELVVFKLEFQGDGGNLNCEYPDRMIPGVIGRGVKRIFHNAIIEGSEMYVFGGPDSRLYRLKIPQKTEIDVVNPLDSYIEQYPYIDPYKLIQKQSEEEDEVKDFEYKPKNIQEKKVAGSLGGNSQSINNMNIDEESKGSNTKVISQAHNSDDDDAYHQLPDNSAVSGVTISCINKNDASKINLLNQDRSINDPSIFAEKGEKNLFHKDDLSSNAKAQEKKIQKKKLKGKEDTKGKKTDDLDLFHDYK